MELFIIMYSAVLRIICENVCEIWIQGETCMLLFSHSGVSDSLQPHGLQHAGLPCPSPTPAVCSNSCPLRHAQRNNDAERRRETMAIRKPRANALNGFCPNSLADSLISDFQPLERLDNIFLFKASSWRYF